jgi:hypothetical protein
MPPRRLPLTASCRTITALAVGVSAACYGGIVDISQFVFYKPFVFTTKVMPQIWRPLTAFLITKPKFAILLDPYFCYQYGSGLERESSRFTQPGDFFVYTAFCASIIVVSSSPPLTLCFVIPWVASTIRLQRPSPRNICPPSLQF